MSRPGSIALVEVGLGGPTGHSRTIEDGLELVGCKPLLKVTRERFDIEFDSPPKGSTANKVLSSFPVYDCGGKAAVRSCKLINRASCRSLSSFSKMSGHISC